MYLNEEMEIADVNELSTKMAGIILKKAELDNNFEGVYSKVFEKMAQAEFVGSEQILEIFGNVGG